MAERVEALPGAPVIVPVNPDAYVYGVALLLSVASGFLFGASLCAKCCGPIRTA